MSTLYPLTTLADTFQALQVDGSAPTVATGTPGWTVAKIAAGPDYGWFAANVKQASTVFGTTALPGANLPGSTAANAFRTQNTVLGSWASGTWTFTWKWIAGVASAQAGKLRVQVWRGTNAAGTGATQITSVDLTAASGVAVNSTTVEVTDTFTWAAGAISLNNEYLFVTAAWQITTASGSNTASVLMRVGNANIATTTLTVNPPNTPTSTAASAITTGGFTANWTTGANDSTHNAASSYILDVATDSGFTSFVNTDQSYNGLNVGNVTTYPVIGLAHGTAYWYRVRATNSGGTSANSSNQNPTTTAAAGSTPGDTYGSTVFGTAGLLNYLRLNETTGTSAADLMGTNTGTYTGTVTLNQTAIGVGLQSAASFDGTTAYVNRSAETLSGRQLTVEAWTYPTVFQTVSPYILDVIGAESTSADVCDLRFGDAVLADNNRPEAVFGVAGAQLAATDPTNRAANAAYHLVATFNGTTLTLYVNGSSVATGSSTGTVTSTTTPFIGAQSGPARFWAGKLSDVAFYNVALTSTQVTDHYTKGTTAPGPSYIPTPDPIFVHRHL